MGSIFRRISNKFRFGRYVGTDHPYTTKTRRDAFVSSTATPSTTNPQTAGTWIEGKLDLILNNDDTIASSDPQYISWINHPDNENSKISGNVYGHKYDLFASGRDKWMDLLGLCHDMRYFQVVQFADKKRLMRKAEMWADIEVMKLYFQTPFTVSKLRPTSLLMGLGILVKTGIGMPIHWISFGYFSGLSSFSNIYDNSQNIDTQYLGQVMHNNIKTFGLQQAVDGFKADVPGMGDRFEQTINHTNNKYEVLRQRLGA